MAYPPPSNPQYPPQQYPPQKYPPQQYPQQAPYPQAQPYPAQAPPPAYQPQPQPVHTTTAVVVQQPVTVTTPAFRDYPVTVVDSNGQQVQTVLEYRAGLLTWIIFAIICLFTLELGICCIAFIPFCIDATKDVYHITPTDGRVVGIYKRLA